MTATAGAVEFAGWFLVALGAWFLISAGMGVLIGKAIALGERGKRRSYDEAKQEREAQAQLRGERHIFPIATENGARSAVTPGRPTHGGSP